MSETASNVPVRCAIYTRKSTDEGLDSGFSSLDAQRESAEALIASQKAEGWSCLPDRYDDGGYTGGNTERPALKRLMADIEIGKVDCVVVYKVDRLSRSLLDFSKLMSAFEERGVSFVSVTQHFNTTQSMGRLTLNILLSFAQFERELISERTRDKIAAARRSGRWAGRPVLGYDIDPITRALTINDAEADTVREIFAACVGGHSLREIAASLNDRGITTKRHVGPSGRATGGRAWSKNTVRRVLAQRLYTGHVPYRDEIHPGLHDGIVDEATFQAAADAIRTRTETDTTCTPNRHNALLKGLLRCGCCGAAMGHTFATSGPKLYRYYACHTAKTQGTDACSNGAFPAHEIEAFVVDQIARLLHDPEVTTRVAEAAESSVPEANIRAGLAAFSPVWDNLPPRDRVELVHHVVSGVEYDPGKGMITIEFHDTGLAAPAEKREAATA